MPTDNYLSREEYVKQIAEGMSKSAVCLSLFTENYKHGTDSLLQFALAMMLDKPIFLLVPEGVGIPNNVRKVAEGIEFYKEGDMKSMHDATKRLLSKQFPEKLKADAD